MNRLYITGAKQEDIKKAFIDENERRDSIISA